MPPPTSATAGQVPSNAGNIDQVGPDTRGFSLDSADIKFTRSTVLRPVPEPGSKELWLQNVCSDHMVTCQWTVDAGWETPEIKPFGDLAISPVASCLHYATQCFEGMKVYRGFDGKLRLFRPDCNAKRLVMSARRVALPSFDDRQLVRLVEALVRVDSPRWLPRDKPGRFLYIRPALIGNGPQLGVEIPREATLFIVAVAWPDFSTESPPGALPRPPGLRLLASQGDITRAWPGGFGHAKVGANYGPSFVAHVEAQRRGYNQVLWLFGPEMQVTEAGASNVFAIIRNASTGQLELLTAPLTDKILLAGVTRRSVLELAQSRLTGELSIAERQFTMPELETAWDEGRVIEIFVSGTAFFITPVSTIHFRGRDLDLPMEKDSKKAKYAALIKGWLTDIMYGIQDHEWAVVVREEGWV